MSHPENLPKASMPTQTDEKTKADQIRRTARRQYPELYFDDSAAITKNESGTFVVGSKWCLVAGLDGT